MLDIGWQELFVIGLVALIIVGPKDLPKVLRAVSQFVRKARGLAREFQGGIAEMVREAELDDIKRKVEGSGRSIESTIKDTVDPTGSLTADFDPAEFNRQIKERVEGGPPSPPAAAATVPQGGASTEVPSSAQPVTQPTATPEPKPKAKATPKTKPRSTPKPKTPGAAKRTASRPS